MPLFNLFCLSKAYLPLNFNYNVIRKCHYSSDVLPQLNMIFLGKDGARWHIRPFQPENFDSVVNTQFDAFYNTNNFDASIKSEDTKPLSFFRRWFDDIQRQRFHKALRDNLLATINSGSPEDVCVLVASECTDSLSTVAESDLEHGCSSTNSDVVGVVVLERKCPSEVANWISISNLEEQSISGTKSNCNELKDSPRPAKPNSSAPIGYSNHGDERNNHCRDDSKSGSNMFILKELLKSPAEACYASDMAAAISVRRRGLGATLLAAAELQAQLWRQRFITFHVLEDNRPARNLYESKSRGGRGGYSVVHRDPQWTRNMFVQPRLFMAKDLGSFSHNDSG